MALLLPELRLLTHLSACITRLRAELEANPTTPKKTWLYQVFGEAASGTFHYFDEAQALLTDDVAQGGPLDITLGFPNRPSGPPSLHLLLPGEGQGQTDWLGMNALPDYSDEEDPDYEPQPYNSFEAHAAGTDGTYGRSFSATYNLMIVAQTSQQAVLLYHLLRAVLIATLPEIDAELKLPKLGGQDVQLDGENGPWAGLYVRTLSIGLSYEARVPSLSLASPTAPVGRFQGHIQA